MNPVKPNVESMLGKMRLVEPSQDLDQSVLNILSEETGMESPLDIANGSARFGWAAIVATALAAGMMGILLGQSSWLFSSPASAIANAPSMDTRVNSQPSTKITPVRFNADAFELLHGHSQQDEYSNCSLCHVAGQKKDAFKSWFYGDDQFFKTHNFKGVANCSACHVVMKEGKKIHDQFLPTPKAKNPHALPGFSSAECSACHVVSAG